MPLRSFILPADRRAIVWHLGSALLLLGLLLLVPLAVAGLYLDAARAAAFAGAAAFCGIAGRLARRGEEPPLHHREAVLIVALLYLLFAVVGAAPFLGVMPPADAFFESMSGFTTTGLTLLDVETTPPALLFFRAYSQWLGGAGIIVISLVVLASSGAGAAQLYESEFGQQNLLGSVVATARLVGGIYAGLTALAYLALLLAGAGGADGLLHALALLSTGGFSPFADSIGGYGGAGIAVVTAVGMVAGAVAFPLYYQGWRGAWVDVLRDAQLRALVVLGAGGAAILALLTPGAPGAAAFHAVSALSTTGYSILETAELGGAARIGVMALMVVGGGLGSTAGGIKLLRLLLLLGLLRWVLLRLLLPKEAAIPLRVGGEAMSTADVRMGLGLLIGYLGIAVGSSLVLSTVGGGFEDASFDAISALSTVGLSSGFTDPDLPALAKAVLIFNMWAGRVEILPVLLLIHPANWRSGRKARS